MDPKTFKHVCSACGREQIVKAFDALRADVSRLLELSSEVLTRPERLRLLARLEDEVRRLPAVRHPLMVVFIRRCRRARRA